jgi:endonuclease/exonuclease/phosphatase family metal-dependent hydrolase
VWIGDPASSIPPLNAAVGRGSVLVSDGLAVDRAEVIPTLASDHLPLAADLRLTR